MKSIQQKVEGKVLSNRNVFRAHFFNKYCLFLQWKFLDKADFARGHWEEYLAFIFSVLLWKECSPQIFAFTFKKQKTPCKFATTMTNRIHFLPCIATEWLKIMEIEQTSLYLIKLQSNHHSLSAPCQTRMAKVSNKKYTLLYKWKTFPFIIVSPMNFSFRKKKRKTFLHLEKIENVSRKSVEI